MDANPKLLVQVRNKLRTNHYSYRTEQHYLAWIRRFINRWVRTPCGIVSQLICASGVRSPLD